jgi:PhzF family phenazine biosynthesis protein
MAIKIYQVDAFCRELFSGNPAAVCPLDRWPADPLLQSIAAENNLAETAFYVREGDRFRLRWFTPTVEVDLCGHATLATAHVLFEHEGFSGERIVFASRSGDLAVDKREGLLHLNFPADNIRRVEITDAMRSWFDVAPMEAYKGRSDYMLVFEDAGIIERLVPDLAAIEKAREARGIIVTAAGGSGDFVSRFFAPQSGIAEDPATGSAHTTLVPFWSGKLGRKTLEAIQLSARRGYLRCRDLGDRVEISGTAKTFMEGRLFIAFETL